MDFALGYDTDEDEVMTTQLQQAMTAGVFVEFHNAQGHSVGQAIFTDWHAPALAGPWQHCCRNAAPIARSRAAAAAHGTSFRQFEVQHEGGTPCVWVRLSLEVAQAVHRGRVHADFSEN